MSRAIDPSPTRDLIVEDDEVIGSQLALGLRGHGYIPTWSRTAENAAIETRLRPFHVVLLDLGLPDADGIDVARALRSEFPALLIIIMTARSDQIDVVAGLDAGADDYLVKPFSITVLLARLRAHLRRRPSPDGLPIVLGGLTVDVSSRRCIVHGVQVQLRPKEFDLLATLAARPNIAVSRETLMAEVWDENWFGSTKTLDVTLAALRRRLAEAGPIKGSVGDLPVIATLRGHGYRLDYGS